MASHGYERSDTFFRSWTRSTNSRSALAQSGNLYSPFRSSGNRPGSASTRQRDSFSCTTCVAACCRAKIITVEPVIFLFMFSLYLYEVMFQLFVFNSYGHDKMAEFRNTSDWVRNHTNSSRMCLTTDLLDNLTNFTLHQTSGHNATHKPHLIGNRVQIQTVILGLIVGTTARLPSIVATLLLGPISDRFGRKPAITVVLTGMILHSVMVLIVVKLDLDLHFLILSAGLRGLTGGMAGILTASYSYIADISSRKWLTIRLGVLESMNFIAGSLSLIIGGVLIHMSNCQFELTAILSLACVVAALPYALIALPESLDSDEKRIVNDEKAVQSRTLGPKSLLRGFQIFFGRRYSRCKLWLCLLIMFITVANISGATSVIILYLLHKPLKWNPIQIGAFLGSSEFVHGLGLIVMLPLLVHSGTRDSVIVMCAVFLASVMDVFLGVADKTWEVFAIGVVQSVDSLVTPALKSIMSKAVDPEDQGALFSFVSAIQVLASVFGYLLYPTVYWHTIEFDWLYSQGIAFFVMAVLYFSSIPFILILVKIEKNQRPDSSQKQRSSRERLGQSTSSATADPASPTSPTDPFEDEYEALLKANTELAVEALDGTSFASRNSELTNSWQSSFRSVQ